MNWETLLGGPNAIWVSSAMLVLAVGLAAWVLIVPSRALSADRRRYGVTAKPSALSRAADVSTGLIDRVVSRRGGRAASAAHALDLAGIKRSVPEFILLVGTGMITGAAVGMFLGGPLVAIMISGMVIAGVFVFVSFRAGKRRGDFADQLDDLVQLLGSNLRAGHSVLQAMDSLTHELQEPAASEIARVVNQARVGRDLGETLEEAAVRMDSDDFQWISQAIAIHRQVGGNLAEVMDTVGETIRERNQIRRQVTALAAEGKLSAYILIALPVFVAVVLQVFNPTYMARLTESALGYAMILLALVLLAIGSWWMSKVIKIKF